MHRVIHKLTPNITTSYCGTAVDIRDLPERKSGRAMDKEGAFVV